MKAIIIVGNGSEIPPYVLSKAVEAITKTTDFDVIEAVQFSDKEVAQALLNNSNICVKKHGIIMHEVAQALLNNSNICVKERGIIMHMEDNSKAVKLYDAVNASILFLVTTYGSPLDNAEAFRFRVTRAYLESISGNLGSQKGERVKSAVEILSSLCKKKISKEIENLLRSNGMEFAPEWANASIRFHNMD